ncbi:MAG: NADH-quinone oxidoreductase subunit NuoE [Firmicutes bacterium]|nr:NADH-quinone oxidoreductase subunit NuoE [Bacillota bacterium]
MCNECGCNNKVTPFPLLDATLAKYTDATGLITVLQKAQEAYGYLSGELMVYIARKMGLPPAKVYGVATFYAQFRLKPVGKHLILLCQGTACHVNGSEAIEEAICAELGIKEGETTPDGLFTLTSVACLGCCSLSPVMMIGGETFGTLTPDKARAILKNIKTSG